MKLKTILLTALASLTIASAAIGQEPDNKDLSGLSREEVTTVSQNDAVEFHKDRPGLKHVGDFGEKFALLHNLRGIMENHYSVEFRYAYEALEAE